MPDAAALLTDGRLRAASSAKGSLSMLEAMGAGCRRSAHDLCAGAQIHGHGNGPPGPARGSHGARRPPSSAWWPSGSAAKLGARARERARQHSIEPMVTRTSLYRELAARGYPDPPPPPGTALYGATRRLGALGLDAETLRPSWARSGVGHSRRPGEEAPRGARGRPVRQRAPVRPALRGAVRGCRASGRPAAACARLQALFNRVVAGLLARVPWWRPSTATRAALRVRLYEIVARVLGNFTRGVAAVSRGLERGLRRWIRAAPSPSSPTGCRLWSGSRRPNGLPRARGSAWPPAPT